MLNPGTVVACLVKLGVTIVCMKCFDDPYSITPKDRAWAVRAYQMLLLHAVLGIFRFGNPDIAKYFRSFHVWLTNAANVLPFAFLTTEILRGSRADERIRLTLLTLGTLPVISELASRERPRLRSLADLIVGLQIFAVIVACVPNGAYGAVSLATSYAFTHYFSEDFADSYDVPHNDLTQYNHCFMEIFAIFTLKDL